MSLYLEDGVISEHQKLNISNGKNSVFLIGDSIRQGYCPFTKRELAPIADVVFPNDNCRFTQYTYVNLRGWRNHFKEPEKVKVVYWNNGHWDIAHWEGADEPLNSIEIYTKMLVRIYRRLREDYPNASIIFSTTTPMNPNRSVGVNPRSTEEIKKYNTAAKQALSGLSVEIDDVFEWIKNFDETYYNDYCHLTEKGFEKLGIHVAQVIKKYL